MIAVFIILFFLVSLGTALFGQYRRLVIEEFNGECNMITDRVNILFHRRSESFVDADIRREHLQLFISGGSLEDQESNQLLQQAVYQQLMLLELPLQDEINAARDGYGRIVSRYSLRISLSAAILLGWHRIVHQLRRRMDAGSVGTFTEQYPDALIRRLRSVLEGFKGGDASSPHAGSLVLGK